MIQIYLIHSFGNTWPILRSSRVFSAAFRDALLTTWIARFVVRVKSNVELLTDSFNITRKAFSNTLFESGNLNKYEFLLSTGGGVDRLEKNGIG